MARIGITEAAARLGLSIDSVRRRLRKGELNAERDNKGVWQVEVADGTVPMQRQDSATLAPAYAPPMQPPTLAGEARRELVEALRSQVDYLTRRLDVAEAERGRLLALLVESVARPAPQPTVDMAPDVAGRVAAAEARAAEAERLLAGELARLRSQVRGLTRRRAGLLARLLKGWEA